MHHLPIEDPAEPQIMKGSISDLKIVVKSLKQISHDNRTTLKDVFYDTIKLTLVRQQRLQKSTLSKQEISKLLNLSHFINVTRSCADIRDELARCQGSITEEVAKKYFADNVQGEVTDSLGRKVEIAAKSVRYLYKDYENRGKHNQVPLAYEEFRGKTLPWIRHTLENSKMILSRDESNVTTFLYCMDYKLFFQKKGVHQNERAIFLVVARKEKRSVLQPIEFITSYRFNDYNRFLKTAEKFTPCK